MKGLSLTPIEEFEETEFYDKYYFKILATALNISLVRIEFRQCLFSNGQGVP